MKNTESLNLLKMGNGDVVWYEDYYTHYNKATNNLIYELVPPFIILENGKEIPFESTKDNTAPISIILPPVSNLRPVRINVDYSIAEVYDMDKKEENLYLYLMPTSFLFT